MMILGNSWRDRE